MKNKNEKIEKDKTIYLKSEPEPKNKQVLNWLQWIVTLGTMIITAIGLFCTVPAIIKNVNNNEQTQVVIEPRDGDIIVKDGNDYKLLQLINNEDISFPTKVQEVQYNYNNSQKERVDINNNNNEDWSKRDSFEYEINSFSINPNKVINLLENIESIVVYCDFYTEKNITTFVDLNEYAFKFTMRESIDDENFEVTKTKQHSNFAYVTKELNDGIEWVKIRVEINYKIGNRHIKDTIVSDWIETDADII